MCWLSSQQTARTHLPTLGQRLSCSLCHCGGRYLSICQPAFVVARPCCTLQSRLQLQQSTQLSAHLSGLQVKDAAKQYRVYYTKTNDSEEDYLVDHSIIMYLVDPRGDFVTFYGKNFTAEDMAKSIAEHIARWQEDGQAT